MPSYPIGAIETFAYEKLSAVAAITTNYTLFNAKPSQDVEGKFIFFEVEGAQDRKVVGTTRIYADGILRVHVVGVRESTNLSLYAGIDEVYDALNNQQFSSNAYGEVLVCVHEQDIPLPYDTGADFTPRTIMEFRVLAN